MMRTDYCGALREKDVGRTVTATDGSDQTGYGRRHLY